METFINNLFHNIFYAHSNIGIQQTSYEFISSIFNRLLCARTYARADIMLLKEHPIYTDYLISSNGDVISKNYNRTGKKKLMKNILINNGYLQVELWKNKKNKNITIHRLVAQTFIDNTEKKPCVNHKDGVKHNNNVSNLEWCTQSENMYHSYRVLGRIPPGNRKGFLGKLCPHSKKVEQIDINSDRVIKVWDSMMDVERELGISNSKVCSVCKNKRKSTGGFKWRYYHE